MRMGMSSAPRLPSEIGFCEIGTAASLYTNRKHGRGYNKYLHNAVHVLDILFTWVDIRTFPFVAPGIRTTFRAENFCQNAL